MVLMIRVSSKKKGGDCYLPDSHLEGELINPFSDLDRGASLWVLFVLCLQLESSIM